MMKVAAVCAFPDGYNTGMLTVDAALHSLFERHFPEAALDLFCIEREVVLRGAAGQPAIRYALLDDARQLADYHAILYWGDFLQSRRYHERSVLRRFENSWTKGDREPGRARVFDTLLLETSPETVLRKAICFGNSMYINSREDDADPRYRSAVARLYANARLIQLRDPVSATVAQRYAPDRTDGLLGVDCALLLKPGELVSWPQWRTARDDAPARTRIGYSFSRSLAKGEASKAAMIDFAEQLGAATGLADVANLGWLDADRAEPLAGLSRKLAEVNECAFVVTDTYHCALNSWREGVPAICIGAGAEKASTTLSEKKKELVYMMFNMTDFYVFFENMRDPKSRAAEVSRIAAVLDPAVVAQHTSTIAAMAAGAERRLVAAITGLG